MWFELGKLTVNLDIASVIVVCLTVVAVVYIRSIKDGSNV